MASVNQLRPPPPPLVWINGRHAVGKRTVAQCLTALLGIDKAVFIDGEQFTDHLDMPAAREQLPLPSSPSPSQGRQGKRDACFARYIEGVDDPEAPCRIVVFADCQPPTPAGEAEARTYQAAAKRAGRLFVPVYLTCGHEEHMRRMRAAEGQSSCGQASCRRGGRDSHGAPDVGQTACEPLFVFPDHDGLEINVTDHEAHVTAIQILQFIRDMNSRKKAATRSEQLERAESA